MPLDLKGKTIDTALLAAELTAAGIAHRGLATYSEGGNVYLHTYDESGRAADLSPGVQAVVDAHVPPAAPNYGSDLLTTDQLRQQAAAAVQDLRAFIAATSPTNAQVVTTLKLIARLTIFMLRRQLG